MSMKLVALASCALLFLAACSPGATPEARLARAGELAAAADYSKAQVELNKLIADGQESAQARRLLAHVSYAQGDLNAVEHNLERAKALGATGEDLIGLRARAYLATGRYDEALTFVTNAGASLNADESRYLRAEALIGSRDFTRALALLGAAEPSQVAQQTRARGLRARAYAGAGDLKNARQELDALLAAEPGQPEASLMLAELSLREQDAQHASKALEAALALRPASGADPWRSRLLRMQAEIDLSIGQLDAARKTLADLKRTDPGARGTHVLAARMAVLDGNSRDAVAELRRLLLEQPEDSYVRLLLAVALVESRNYNQAEQQLSAILSKSPDDTQARLALARLQLMQGRLDAAQALLEEGEAGPEKSALLGLIKLRLGDSATAIDLLRASLAAKPDDPGRALDLAEAYLSVGDAQQASDALGKVTSVSKDQQGRLQRVRFLVRVLESGINVDRSIEDMVSKLPDDIPLRLLAAGVYTSNLDKPTAARRHLQEALRRAPTDTRVLMALARLESATGDFDASRAAFMNVLKVEKDNVSAISGLAWLAVRRGDTGELASWRTELDRLSGPRVRVEALRLALYQKDTFGAQRAEKTLLEEIADPAIANYALGGIYLDAGQVRAARDRLRKAAEARADVPEYWLRLAQAEASLGELSAAENALNQALVARPAWLPAARQLVSVSLQRQNPTRALAVVKELREQRQNDLALMVLDADTRAAAGRPAEAAALYEAVYRRRADRNVLMRWVAARRAAGIPAPEQPLLARLEQAPDDPTLRLDLAMQHQKAGNAAGAIVEYRKALAAEPANPVALNNLAWLLFEGKRGAPAEALELARRAHAAAPSSAQIMDTLGWILFSIGRRDEALPMLEQAAKLAPANEQVVGHLAEAKRSAGSPAGG